MLLKDKDHYVRYCAPRASKVDKNRILPAAFALRKTLDDDGLSGDHLEHFADGLIGVLAALKKRYKGMETDGCFAKLFCGKTIKTIKDKCALDLSFVKNDSNDSHTLLTGYGAGHEYDGVCLLLSKLAVKTESIKKLRASGLSDFH